MCGLLLLVVVFRVVVVVFVFFFFWGGGGGGLIFIQKQNTKRIWQMTNISDDSPAREWTALQRGWG